MSTQMGYVEQSAAPYVQQQDGAVVPVAVNGVAPGVMPVGMPVQQGGMPSMTGITRVYVGNLSWETEWQDLKDHMRTAGEVCDIFHVCIVVFGFTAV